MIRGGTRVLSSFVRRISFFTGTSRKYRPTCGGHVGVDRLAAKVVRNRVDELRRTSRPIRVRCRVRPRVCTRISRGYCQGVLLGLLRGSVSCDQRVKLVGIIIRDGNDRFDYGVTSTKVKVSRASLPRM